MLEPIREYALEQLAARGEAAVLQHAHAVYYMTLAEAAAAQWVSPATAAAIAQLERERDNMRAALQWACKAGASARSDHLIGLRLAGALARFWRRSGAMSEGRAWLEELLALNDDTPDAAAQAARLRALQGAAWLASDQHDYARATQLFEQSMALRRALGESEDETNLLTNAAIQARAEGQYARATALLEDVLAQQRALGNRGGLSSFGVGLSLFLLGMVQREQGDFARATALFEECIAFHRALGDREGVAQGLLGLSDVARDQGDVVQMRRCRAESLVLLPELGVQWAIGFALNNLALAAQLEGDLAQALALISESVAMFRAQQAGGSLAEVLITQGQILRELKDVIAAHEALREALQLAWTLGPRLMVVAALEALAGHAPQPSQSILAARFLAAASALRVQMGAPVRPADQGAVARTLATTRATLQPDVFAAIWAEAETLSPEQILNAIPSAATFSAGAPAAPDAQPALAPRESQPPAAPAPARHGAGRVDWGLAPDAPVLYGRTHELTTLSQWVVGEQCRVITLVGLGGIGKTKLIAR
jgi:tetratricopeptide (TPR) repeat protein